MQDESVVYLALAAALRYRRKWKRIKVSAICICGGAILWAAIAGAVGDCK